MIMRKGNVFIRGELCGTIIQDEDGFAFRYEADWLARPEAEAASLTLPLTKEAYRSNILFPFFDGLIPEGYLLEVAVRHFGIPASDRMGLLLKACRETIGCVSVVEANEDE